jgi:hypothetical protein
MAVIALLVAVLSVYECRQTDPDTWGHLRYGQFSAEHGPSETVDPFAYTSEGLTWHRHEWLSQWLLWQAYHLGGPLGLIALKCLVGGGAIYFLWRAIRLGSDDPRIWAPVVMLAAAAVGRWFLFRPQVFTFCFFAYFTYVLLSYVLDRPARLWTLPPVLALWANLHGAFLAGLGVIGLALGLRCVQAFCRRDFRPRVLWPLGLTLIAGLGATFISPFGVGIWQYVLTEMTHDVNRRMIDEWMPLLRFGPDYNPHHNGTILTVFLLLGLLMLAGVLAQLRPGRVADIPAWVWLLGCVPLTWMTFQSIRHVPVLILWAAPVLSILAGAAAKGWAGARVWDTSWLAGTGLIGMLTFFTLYALLSDPRPQISTPPNLYPAGPVAFMRSNGLQGNVYAPLHWGSYLTWELYPQVRVAMDSRNVTLFTSDQVEEDLTYFSDTDPDVPLRYATDFVLVPADATVLPALRQSPHWEELYVDKFVLDNKVHVRAVLFVRNDEAHAAITKRNKRGELVHPEVPPMTLFE